MRRHRHSPSDSPRARRSALDGAHTLLVAPALADYLGVMTRAVFQAGLRWADIDRQWSALCDAFDGFDPRKVARYEEQDVERIMNTPGVLHSERKINATIANAKAILELDKNYGGFRKYLGSFASYDKIVTDLRRHFKYVGEISAYYFLYRVGEKVPPFGRWIKSVEGDHPRIQEMVKQ